MKEKNFNAKRVIIVAIMSVILALIAYVILKGNVNSIAEFSDGIKKLLFLGIFIITTAVSYVIYSLIERR